METVTVRWKRFPSTFGARPCLLSCLLGGLLFGYHLAVFSTVTTFRSFQDWFGLWPSGEQVLLGSYFVGAFVGCLFQRVLPFLAHGAGTAAWRRYLWLRWSSVFFCLGSGLPFLIKRERMLTGRFQMGAFLVLLIHRLLIGIGAGIVNVLGPALCLEVAPSTSRGAFVFLYQLAITIGILMANLVNLATGHEDVHRQVDPVAGGAGIDMRGNFLRPLRYPLVPAILMCIGLLRYQSSMGVSAYRDATSADMLETGKPMSQRKEREHSMVASARALRPDAAEAGHSFNVISRPSLQNESLSLKDVESFAMYAVLARGSSPTARSRASVWLLLRDPRIQICMILQLLQQLTGINVVLVYGVQILEQVQSSAMGSSRRLARLSGPLYGAVLLSVMNVIATLVAVGIIDRTCRRKLYLFSTPVLAACHLALARATRAENGSSSVAFTGFLALMLFVAVFAVSHGPLAVLVANELFSPEARASANSIGMVVNAVATTAVSIGFPLLQRELFGIAGTFLFFALILMGGEYWLWRYLPETRQPTSADSS